LRRRVVVPKGETGGRVRWVKTWLDAWPVYRQLTGSDPLGRGKAARSKATEAVVARTATADRVAKSVCPYCAVGCAQNVYVKDEKIVQIEGNPDSPVNRGRLCPKGSASKSLVTSPTRVTTVRYRRPYGTEWEDLDLDTAMEMIADRVLDARNKTWQESDEKGRRLRRNVGIGAIQIENQARI
jgi:formate dehydrogenase major subunit